MSGQPVGPGGQLQVGQPLVAALHRGRVGRAGGLVGEQRRQRRPVLLPLRAAPLLQHGGQLGRRHRRQRRQRPGRVAGELRQQHQVVRGDPVDRGRVEQVGVVLDPQPAPVRCRHHHHRQVELAGPRVQVEGRHLQPGHLPGRRGRVLQREQHREQRGPAQVPARPELLHQPLERHPGVRVGIQAGLPDPGHQLGHGRVAGDVRAQHRRAGEEADQRLGLRPVPAGHRGADHDVPLAAVAGQQQVERGQREHERRRAEPGRRRCPPGTAARRAARASAARRPSGAPPAAAGPWAARAPGRRPAGPASAPPPPPPPGRPASRAGRRPSPRTAPAAPSAPAGFRCGPRRSR